MELCYLILAHERILQLRDLIIRLSGEHVHFVVHVDRKCGEDISLLSSIPGCTVLSDRFSVTWGSIMVVESVLALCRRAVEEGPYDYYVLLSGSDYPVKSAAYLYRFFSLHRANNYMEGIPLPSSSLPWLQGGYRRIYAYALPLDAKSIATIEPRVLDWNNLRQFLKTLIRSPHRLGKAFSIWLFARRRRIPGRLRPYGGEMWWMMNGESLVCILNYLVCHPEYLEYHLNTQIPDELFFNTLVFNLCAHTENRTMRYIHWRNRKDSSPLWLELGDVSLLRGCIKDPDCLFVRKVKDLDVIRYINIQVDGTEF